VPELLEKDFAWPQMLLAAKRMIRKKGRIKKTAKGPNF
jgi:hypothetical protein